MVHIHSLELNVLTSCPAADWANSHYVAILPTSPTSHKALQMNFTVPSTSDMAIHIVLVLMLPHNSTHTNNLYLNVWKVHKGLTAVGWILNGNSETLRRKVSECPQKLIKPSINLCLKTHSFDIDHYCGLLTALKHVCKKHLIVFCWWLFGKQKFSNRGEDYDAWRLDTLLFWLSGEMHCQCCESELTTTSMLQSTVQYAILKCNYFAINRKVCPI